MANWETYRIVNKRWFIVWREYTLGVVSLKFFRNRSLHVEKLEDIYIVFYDEHLEIITKVKLLFKIDW